MAASGLQPYVVGRRPERLDHIAKAIYGGERGGVVEALLAANPGLALQGAFIAPRTVLQVPAAAAIVSTSTFVPLGS